jgi:hypothetical protein
MTLMRSTEREEWQKLAAAIVAAVRDNTNVPLPGLQATAIQYKGIFFDCVDVEAFVFELALEITTLIEERRLRDDAFRTALTEALDQWQARSFRSRMIGGPGESVDLTRINELRARFLGGKEP